MRSTRTRFEQAGARLASALFAVACVLGMIALVLEAVAGNGFIASHALKAVVAAILADWVSGLSAEEG